MSKTELVVFGPFDIPYGAGNGSSKRIDKSHAQEFVEYLKRESLATKHGCYIFALKAGKGFSPWYVGMTSRGFGKECMETYQRDLYNGLLYAGRKGRPVMYFVAAPDTKNKIPAAVCDELEEVLIQSAHARNPGLLNSKRKKIADWSVHGVIRSGKGKVPANAKSFRTMMGL